MGLHIRKIIISTKEPRTFNTKINLDTFGDLKIFVTSIINNNIISFPKKKKKGKKRATFIINFLASLFFNLNSFNLFLFWLIFKKNYNLSNYVRKESYRQTVLDITSL